MRYYRMQAKGLLTFAGMLEYQLPATALARLSTTEVRRSQTVTQQWPLTQSLAHTQTCRLP